MENLAEAETGLPRERAYSWSDPAELSSVVAGVSGIDFLTAVANHRLPSPPIALTLGFTLVEVAEGRVVFTAEPAEWQYNPIGSVHGGVACTLADSAMGCAVHTVLPAGTGYTTTDLQVRFIRPLVAGMGTVRAVGQVVHYGRRTATAEARLSDSSGRLLAYATCSCLVVDITGPSSG